MSNMIVARAPKDGNFTCVNNEHMFDSRISGMAQSILTKVLALKDTWEFTMQGLYSMYKEGQHAVQKAFNELIKAGYAVRRQIRDEHTNQWGQMMYYFYESPSLNPYLSHPKGEAEQLLLPTEETSEMPVSAASQKPLSGNSAQSNTKKSNTVLSLSVGGLTDKNESEQKEFFSEEELLGIKTYLEECSGCSFVKEKGNFRAFCNETVRRLMDMLRTGKISNKKEISPAELLSKIKEIQKVESHLITFMGKLQKYCDQALTGLKDEQKRENFLKSVTVNFIMEHVPNEYPSFKPEQKRLPLPGNSPPDGC